MLKFISTIVAGVCLSLAASAAPATAKRKPGKKTVARLSDAAMQALKAQPTNIRALKRAMPNFKVPAITKQILICEVSRSNVLVCIEQNTAERCPTEIQMKVDGLDNMVTVGVTCEPNTPDMNGECECELK